MNDRYELVHLSTVGDCYLAQLAVEGHLTQSFYVHRAIRLDPRFESEESFMVKLCEYADQMYAEYGDIRERTLLS